MDSSEGPRVILKELQLEHNVPRTDNVIDKPFSIESFKECLKIVVVALNDIEMEFDMIGVHPTVANMFRRTMISGVPSMAFDKVIIANNTTLLRDEVLAHRLGLIPLKADPRLFEYRLNDLDDGYENDTLEFELKVKCTTQKKKEKDVSTEIVTLKGNKVFSGNLKWIPIGDQSSKFQAKDVGPVDDDILINVLRPEMEIDAKLIAVKGVGRDHAKFSPVCTASYRICPDIRLTRQVKGNEALRLQKYFSPGVIKINDDSVAYVANSRYDTCSRNVYMDEELKDAVIMTRFKDHFIFSIESVGAMTPNEIFVESVREMKRKVAGLLEFLDSIA